MTKVVPYRYYENNFSTMKLHHHLVYFDFNNEQFVFKQFTYKNYRDQTHRIYRISSSYYSPPPIKWKY